MKMLQGYEIFDIGYDKGAPGVPTAYDGEAEEIATAGYPRTFDSDEYTNGYAHAK